MSIYEIYHLWNVPAMKCPSYEMFIYEMLIYEMSVYEMSVYEMSVKMKNKHLEVFPLYFEQIF